MSVNPVAPNPEIMPVARVDPLLATFDSLRFGYLQTFHTPGSVSTIMFPFADSSGRVRLGPLWVSKPPLV